MTVQQLHLVTFRVREQLYGVDIMQVHRVLLVRNLVHVPGAAPHLRGLLELHDQMIAVVDLMYLLRGEAAPPDAAGRPSSSHRVVVVHPAPESLLGLDVDDVGDPIRVEAVAPPPAEATVPAVAGIFTHARERGIMLDPTALRAAVPAPAAPARR